MLSQQQQQQTGQSMGYNFSKDQKQTFFRPKLNPQTGSPTSLFPTKTGCTKSQRKKKRKSKKGPKFVFFIQALSSITTVSIQKLQNEILRRAFSSSSCKDGTQPCHRCHFHRVSQHALTLPTNPPTLHEFHHLRQNQNQNQVSSKLSVEIGRESVEIGRSQ